MLYIMYIRFCQNKQDYPYQEECCLPVRKVVGLNPGQAESMTYIIVPCCYEAWYKKLLAQGKNWLTLYQDTVTELDTRSCCQWPGLPTKQHKEVASSVHCHKSVLVLVGY